MKLKKGDISMTTIVTAVIAILVLLTAIAIFSTNMKTPAEKLRGTSTDEGIKEKVKEITGSAINGPCYVNDYCDSKNLIMRNIEKQNENF